MPGHRFRIRFAKQGDLRLIGHHDLVTALERQFRRLGVRVCHSAGFHPRPKLSFPLSLALGIAGMHEVFEVELVEALDPQDLLAQLQTAAPDGLVFHSAEPIEPQTSKARVESVTYEFPLPAARRAPVEQQARRLMASPSYTIQREARNQPIDLLAALVAAEVVGDRLRIRMRVLAEAAARPQEVLAALGIGDLLDEGHFLTRTEVTLAAGNPKHGRMLQSPESLRRSAATA